MIKQYVSEKQYNRTIKLLYKTRQKLGIDAYILMKKILIVAAITTYYDKKGYWISYEFLLTRNESLLKEQDCDITRLIRYNGLLQKKTFDIDTNIILKSTTIQMQIITINKYT